MTGRNRKTGKKFAAMILTAVFIISVNFASSADGLSGPASDTELAANLGNEAKGPAAQFTEQQVQPEEQAAQPEQPPVQPEEQSSQPEQPPIPSEPPSTEGLIASGGRYIDPNKPMVALTFDDGPYAPVGNRIMDSLELYNGRSTFFVVGNRVMTYQSEVMRMANNGHEIGNHTYEHKYLNKLNASQIRSQIELCNQVVASVTGQVPALVRLPGGNKNNTVLANINQPIIMWNVDTLDWKTRNASKTVQAVLSNVKDGDIILMHELYDASGDAAVTLIPALVQRGYQLVTVSELARFRGGLNNKGIYFNFPK